MALTAAQTCAVYEMIGAIVGLSTIYVHSGTMPATGIEDQDEFKSLVDTALEALSADQLTRVGALADEWETIRLYTGSLDAGAIGTGIQGVSDSYDAQRTRLKELLTTYVPIFHIRQWLERRAGGAPNVIPVLR